MGSLGFSATGQFQVNDGVPNWGKNYIINGGFDRWDYATSQTTSGYGSDNRWSNDNVVSTKTHSRIASTDTERVFFNSPYFSRTAVTSVAGVSNYCLKYQRIENVTKLAGKTVTISFWAKADTNKNIAINLTQGFGTGGTPSANVAGIGSQLVVLTSSWQKKTITVTFPSIIGKTLGTDGVNTSFTSLVFFFDAGSSVVTQFGLTGMVQQSGTFDIAEVQLEEGSVATYWSPYNGEFGGEVQACERYYEKSYNSELPPATPTVAGAVFSTTINTTVASGQRFRTKKRIMPTINLYSPLGTSSTVWDINDLNVSVGTAIAFNVGIAGFRYCGGTWLATSMVTYHYTASAEL